MTDSRASHVICAISTLRLDAPARAQRAASFRRTAPTAHLDQRRQLLGRRTVRNADRNERRGIGG